jgi:hypothetical protein
MFSHFTLRETWFNINSLIFHRLMRYHCLRKGWPPRGVNGGFHYCGISGNEIVDTRAKENTKPKKEIDFQRSATPTHAYNKRQSQQAARMSFQTLVAGGSRERYEPLGLKRNEIATNSPWSRSDALCAVPPSTPRNCC